jgi:alpha-N-arabinofuranosidase
MNIKAKKLTAVSLQPPKTLQEKFKCFLTNIDYSKPQEVSINLRGRSFLSYQEHGHRQKINDFNSFETPNKITVQDFKGAKLEKVSWKLTLPRIRW